MVAFYVTPDGENIPPEMAVEKVLSQPLSEAREIALLHWAVHAPLPATRLKAAEGISALASWQQLLETAADRDRRVWRLAKQHVTAWEQQQRVIALRIELENELQQIIDHHPVDLLRLADCDRRYASIEVVAGAGRYNELRGLLDQRIAIEQRETRQVQEAIDVLASKLSETPASRLAIETATAGLQSLLGSITAGDIPTPLLRHAQSVLAEVGGVVGRMSEEEVHQAVAEKHILRFLSLVKKKKRVTPPELRHIKKEWESLNWGAWSESEHSLSKEHSALSPVSIPDTSLEGKAIIDAVPRSSPVEGGGDVSLKISHWRTLFDKEIARLTTAEQQYAEQEKKQVERLEKQLQAWIAELESALTGGETTRAISILQRLEQWRSRSGTVAVATISQMDRAWRDRLQTVEQQALDLRKWQQFNIDQQRAALIEAACGLRDGALPATVLNKELMVLRERWKSLDQSPIGGATSQQWREFNQPLDQVWEKIKGHRAEEQKVREQYALQREAVLVDARALVAKFCLVPGKDKEVEGTPPSEADWKQFPNLRAKLQERWREIGVPPDAVRVRLYKEWDRCFDLINKVYKSTRQQERERREALIALVKAQLEKIAPEEVSPVAQGKTGEVAVPCSDQPTQAIDIASGVKKTKLNVDWTHILREVQRAQRNWAEQRHPMPLPRDEEEKLWQRFHGYCQAVFVLRETARQEERTEQDEKARREVLRAEAEKERMAKEQEEAAIEREKMIAEERRRATILSQLSGLDQTATHLELMLSKASGTLENAELSALYERVRQQERDLHSDIKEYPGFFSRIQQLLGTDTSSLGEGAERGGVSHASNASNPSNARITPSKPAVKGGGVRKETAVLGRSILLLDMEIALELPSPLPLAAKRRIRQIERLNQAMKERLPPPSPKELLADYWAQPGEAEIDEERISAIIGVLQERQQKEGRVLKSSHRESRHKDMKRGISSPKDKASSFPPSNRKFGIGERSRG